MKKLILILLLCVPFLGITQTHTFTEKEVVEMDSLFQVYEQNDSLQKLEINLLNVQLGNYKTLHVQDSLHIAFMNDKTLLQLLGWCLMLNSIYIYGFNTNR